MYSDGRDSDAEDGARSCCGCGPRTSRGRGRVAGLGHARVLIWIWPKLLCFLLVVLTHYQLLRYLFHVIIPGEQQLCALWSTLQPAQDFAKWSKQREIRHISYQLATLLRKQTGI